MATAPTLTLVPVDEYLRSSYEHDMEYVDGVLIRRGVPTIPHSLLQKLLLIWFARYEDEHQFETLPEVRTQIAERARYRIPDVMLCPRPIPDGRICDVVPWAIVEVLSPDDTLAETRDRFLDYKQIGVQSLILMDPERYLAYEFRDGSLIVQRFNVLSIANGRVDFDSDAIFAQLRDRRSGR